MPNKNILHFKKNIDRKSNSWVKAYVDLNLALLQEWYGSESMIYIFYLIFSHKYFDRTAAHHLELFQENAFL